jgi:hypothetical protein
MLLDPYAIDNSRNKIFIISITVVAYLERLDPICEPILVEKTARTKKIHKRTKSKSHGPWWQTLF